MEDKKWYKDLELHEEMGLCIAGLIGVLSIILGGIEGAKAVGLPVSVGILGYLKGQKKANGNPV